MSAPTQNARLSDSDILNTLREHLIGSAERVFCTLYQREVPVSVTFGDLAGEAGRFATYLRRRTGIGEQDVVAIILPHGVELLWSFLGVMYRGAVPTFMPFPSAKQDPQYYWHSHAALFDKIGVRLLVSSIAFRQQIEKYLDLDVLFVEEIAEDLNGCEIDEWPAAAPESTAFLQHSSGTTGLKKGVMLSHASVLTQVRSYAAEIGFAGHHVIASWLPLYHDMGLIACFMMPLITGASVVMLDPFEWVARPSSLLDVIAGHRANFVWMPNFAFRHIVRTAPREAVWDLSSVTAFINCSEPCKPAEFELFLERFRSCGVAPETLQVCYAMAENVFAVTQTPLNAPPHVISVRAEPMDGEGRIEFANDDQRGRRLLSCGPPLPATDLRIAAPDGNPLPDRRVGEIVLRSPSLFSGYNRLPEVTAKKLVDGWYKTGDLGFLDNGELYVCGRVDDLIVVYGRNYYAHEIEEAANTVSGIVPGRVVAFGIESATLGTTEVVILAELQDRTDPVPVRRSVKSVVLDRVGVTVQTVAFVARGQLAKSTAGKISRDRNKAHYLTTLAEPVHGRSDTRDHR